MIGDGGERGPVCEITGSRGGGGGEDAALVGGDEGGAVGPVVGCVGGGVDGEDDVDVAVGFDSGGGGDVFEVFAAVDEVEVSLLGCRGR